MHSTVVRLPVCSPVKSSCSNSVIINLFVGKRADTHESEPKQCTKVTTCQNNGTLASLCAYSSSQHHIRLVSTAGDYHVILDHWLRERHHMRWQSRNNGMLVGKCNAMIVKCPFRNHTTDRLLPAGGCFWVCIKQIRGQHPLAEKGKALGQCAPALQRTSNKSSPARHHTTF